MAWWGNIQRHYTACARSLNPNAVAHVLVARFSPMEMFRVQDVSALIQRFCWLTVPSREKRFVNIKTHGSKPKSHDFVKGIMGQFFETSCWGSVLPFGVQKKLFPRFCSSIGSRHRCIAGAKWVPYWAINWSSNKSHLHCRSPSKCVWSKKIVCHSLAWISEHPFRLPSKTVQVFCGAKKRAAYAATLPSWIFRSRRFP